MEIIFVAVAAVEYEEFQRTRKSTREWRVRVITSGAAVPGLPIVSRDVGGSQVSFIAPA